MSDENIKRSTKKHRKPEREEKGSKTKKSRTPGTARNSHDLSLQPSITKLESTRDSTLTWKDGDQLSSTPPDTLVKVKASKKRKRTDRNVIHDDSVNSETGSTKLEPPKNKKRDKHQQEDAVQRLPYPDPAIDESLSEQSRRALSYVYEQCRGIDAWKFNKARQNWLLRNLWSEQAVPESYVPLVVGYLASIKGSAREKLIEECISKTSSSEGVPTQSAQPSDDSNKVGLTINQQTNTSRAQFILDALRKNS